MPLASPSWRSNATGGWSVTWPRILTTGSRIFFRHPEDRGIVRRIQTMAATRYGEIRANLLDRDVLPMHPALQAVLLRREQVRPALAPVGPQHHVPGAPLLEDIGHPFDDDWFLPLAPAQETA